MYVHTGVVICLLSIVVVRTAPPVITQFDKVMSVKEGTLTNMELSQVTCIDPDGDLTKVKITNSVPPSIFFEIIDCNSAECINYRAGVGTLRYTPPGYYLLTITCDDNKGGVVKEVVQVNVIPNLPPYFDPDVQFTEVTSLSGKEGPDTLIYNVDCIDDDGDSITYSMSVIPSTSSNNYRIERLTGEVFSNIDLRSECRNDVTFQVYCSDGRSTSGPFVISAPFSNPNVAPVCMSATTIMIPEVTTGIAYTKEFLDGNNDPVTYTFSANNAAGVAQFTLDGKSPFKIDIATPLDYENSALRQTDLVITLTDGFCPSPPCPLRIQVTDVNEPPTISPLDSTIKVCEGQSEFQPAYSATDPDILDTQDTLVWSIDPATSNSQGRFSINMKTGAIIVLVDYDVEKDLPDHTSPMPTTQKIIVKVKDRGGLTASATVTVIFIDCNDNFPLIDQAAYEFATTDCAAGGTILGSISGKDKDLTAPNNVIYFEGSGGACQVGTGGEVFVSQPLPAGSVSTFLAYVWDRGVDPSPLRSPTPAAVSCRFTPCPTPPPPPQTQAPTPAPAVTTTTTPKPTVTTAAPKKFTRTDSDPNLPWIIIAGLLGAFMLGLLAYMLWRYGRLCAECCSRINCAKTCRGRPPMPKKVIESACFFLLRTGCQIIPRTLIPKHNQKNRPTHQLNTGGPTKLNTAGPTKLNTGAKKQETQKWKTSHPYKNMDSYFNMASAGPVEQDPIFVFK